MNAIENVKAEIGEKYVWKKSNYAVIDLEIHLEIVLCCGSEVEEKREIPSQLRLH